MFLNTVFLEILMFFSETRQLSFPIVVIKKKFYLLCVFLKDKRFASLFPKSKFCNETLVKPGAYGIHDTMRDGYLLFSWLSVISFLFFITFHFTLK